jgi:hypothetical protein
VLGDDLEDELVTLGFQQLQSPPNRPPIPDQK